MFDFFEVLIINEKTSMLQRLGFSEAILTPQHSHILPRRGAKGCSGKVPLKKQMTSEKSNLSRILNDIYKKDSYHNYYDKHKKTFYLHLSICTYSKTQIRRSHL